MKIHRVFAMILMAGALAIVGCKKQEGVDTSKLEKSFAGAEAAAKSGLDNTLAAIKSSDYAGALSELKSLGEKVKLTPDQEQAVKDVVAQLQKLVADAANKAAGEAGKAADDLQKSLQK